MEGGCECREGRRKNVAGQGGEPFLLQSAEVFRFICASVKVSGESTQAAKNFVLGNVELGCNHVLCTRMRF